MSQQRFQSFRGMFFQIGEGYFEFLPDPSFPGEREIVFRLEGGTAYIYKIIHVDSGELYALKVFKPGFRTKYLSALAASLAHYPHLAALQVERRVYLTRNRYADLLNAYPELEYAILMPWVSEPGWAGFLLNPQLSSNYTSEQALRLARSTAEALTSLEADGLAHADIAGSNVVPVQDRQRILLLDLENMYLPHLPKPQQKSQGTPGYQHRHRGSQGQWCPEGDRFAGAILLTEMLTWWKPRVRAHVAEEAESLFKPEELQTSFVPCLPLVRETLYAFSPRLAELFNQAWLSSSLAACPPLRDWAEALQSARPL